MAFITVVVEYWLELENTQCVHMDSILRGHYL